MSGYRDDSRQLFVNTEVCQPRLSHQSNDGQLKDHPIKTDQPVPISRDNTPKRK